MSKQAHSEKQNQTAKTKEQLDESALMKRALELEKEANRLAKMREDMLLQKRNKEGGWLSQFKGVVKSGAHILVEKGVETLFSLGSGLLDPQLAIASLHIRSSDYMFPAGTVLKTFEINSTMFDDVNDNLQKKLSMYNYYAFLNTTVKFTPSQGELVNGQLGMFFVPDPDLQLTTTDSQTIVRLVRQYGGDIFRLDKSCSVKIPAPSKPLYTASGNIEDARFQSQGTLFVVCVTDIDATGTLGEFSLSYTVEMAENNNTALSIPNATPGYVGIASFGYRYTWSVPLANYQDTVPPTGVWNIKNKNEVYPVTMPIPLNNFSYTLNANPSDSNYGRLYLPKGVYQICWTSYLMLPYTNGNNDPTLRQGYAQIDLFGYANAYPNGYKRLMTLTSSNVFSLANTTYIYLSGSLLTNFDDYTELGFSVKLGDAPSAQAGVQILGNIIVNAVNQFVQLSQATVTHKHRQNDALEHQKALLTQKLAVEKPTVVEEKMPVPSIEDLSIEEFLLLKKGKKLDSDNVSLRGSRS